MMLENEDAKVDFGFMGITFGLDYYHSKKQYIHIGFSCVSGGSSRKNPGIEHMNSIDFSLSNNHKIRRFSVGYGLSYARNTWNYSRWGWFLFPFIIEDVSKSHNTFGLIFPNYYQIGEYFNFGVVYRPTFYRPNLPDKFIYEHLISIDFAWKIRLNR